MAPGATDARCVTGRTATSCAAAAGMKQRSTRPPTAADELTVLLIGSLFVRTRPLGRVDRKVHVPRESPVGDLVGHLDLQPVLPLREGRERDRLAALQLMARRHVELRRQRLRIEALWVR